MWRGLSPTVFQVHLHDCELATLITRKVVISRKFSETFSVNLIVSFFSRNVCLLLAFRLKVEGESFLSELDSFLGLEKSVLLAGVQKVCNGVPTKL